MMTMITTTIATPQQNNKEKETHLCSPELVSRGSGISLCGHGACLVSVHFPPLLPPVWAPPFLPFENFILRQTSLLFNRNSSQRAVFIQFPSNLYPPTRFSLAPFRLRFLRTSKSRVPFKVCPPVAKRWSTRSLVRTLSVGGPFLTRRCMAACTYGPVIYFLS